MAEGYCHRLRVRLSVCERDNVTMTRQMVLKFGTAMHKGILSPGFNFQTHLRKNKYINATLVGRAEGLYAYQ